MNPEYSTRIGILGGTFDPIHEGHLALAQSALTRLRLDRLFLVPAFRHPLEQKQGATVASAKERLEMTRLAAADKPQIEVSDCEVKREGISYTVDTLRFFRKRFPKPAELLFITGGDWGKSLDQWKDMNAVFSLAHFVIAKRPGFDTQHLPPQVEFLDFVPLAISSTQVRDQLQQGIFPQSLVPKRVLTYIQEHRLYRS